MDNHRLDELISAKLSGMLDERGQQELEALLQENPEQRLILQQLEDYWNEQRIPVAPAPHLFDEMMKKANVRPVRRLWVRWVAAAAVAGLICTAGFLYRSGRQEAPQVVQTAKGERRHFQLEDGTKVYLNADSKLSCRIDQQSREIWLEGEAYFDVAKDARRPFTVHALSLQVRALGTAFNVKAYPGDKRLETTLVEGLVEVTEEKHPGRKIRLQPLEKIAFQATDVDAGSNTVAAVVTPVKLSTPVLENADSTINETAWINNRLQFDMMRFEELAQLLERWYNVKIIIQNTKAKDYIFSGSFGTETIDQALTALQLTEDFKFEHNGTSIIIH